jgi:hypothetical protein
MKKEKIIYWVTTAILSLIIVPGIFFMNTEFALAGPRHLGIPNWLRLEVGIANFLAGLVLVIPYFKGWIKEQAYVGLGFTYLSALIGHFVIDGVGAAVLQAIVFFAVLLTSYIYYHKLQKNTGNL